MTTVLAWFAGTRVGHWLAAAGAGALVALGIVARVYGAGQRAEESRQTRDSLDALRERNRTDDQVDALSARARRDEFAGWVRDDRA
ncbi:MULTISPECIES: hypothetical protein [Aurantimonadaceae]|jgi:hypothetical protein|uniref:hypothetical protein n=1 Tax=Aurantimonadaceae TaxID=255475 RepID=UPI00030F8F2B|nr:MULTISPECIES: hypothetical protein [Aurantimonadaceae]MAU97684.1 hypothetical protein [Fulvimarina sp.]MCQ0989870.1 hypothetical protein [Jiella sp. LLJ827]